MSNGSRIAARSFWLAAYDLIKVWPLPVEKPWWEQHSQQRSEHLSDVQSRQGNSDDPRVPANTHHYLHDDLGWTDRVQMILEVAGRRPTEIATSREIDHG